METVYADSLVLLNAFIDYLLLLSAGKLCALPLRRWRMGLGALWGGAYALLAVVWPGIFALFTVKLLAGALAVVIAFGCHRRTLRAIVAFYAVSAAFAGALYGASSLAGRETRGGVYLPVSLKMLLLSFALCYAAVSLVFRHRGNRAARKIHRVEITSQGRTVVLSALEDTGNELVDPANGNAVLVAGAEALAPLFDPETPLGTADVIDALETLNARRGPRFRLLPCATAAAERTLLLCFTPEELRVNGSLRRDVSVAVSPHPLSPDGEYQAVL